MLKRQKVLRPTRIASSTNQSHQKNPSANPPMIIAAGAIFIY